uniref:Uncharacterized protein n=1 Tax=Octopus bimaculoides TaxID=37653 RepID=A0A0L8FNE2_OCTBM
MNIYNHILKCTIIKIACTSISSSFALKHTGQPQVDATGFCWLHVSLHPAMYYWPPSCWLGMFFVKDLTLSCYFCMKHKRTLWKATESLMCSTKDA